MKTQLCGRCRIHLPIADFAPSRRGLAGQWCRTCYREHHLATYVLKQPATLDDRLCANCGEVYTPKQRRASTFCSRSCKDNARNARARDARMAGKPARSCVHCGLEIPRRVYVQSVFCSKRCSYAAHALQRKLRARTGQADKPGHLRAAICERDKWRCGICSGPVDRTLRYPDPMCASLDHVVPVSEGGLSTMANLRLTHLVCNLRRRNRGGLEQLALV